MVDDFGVEILLVDEERCSFRIKITGISGTLEVDVPQGMRMIITHPEDENRKYDVAFVEAN